MGRDRECPVLGANLRDDFLRCYLLLVRQRLLPVVPVREGHANGDAIDILLAMPFALPRMPGTAVVWHAGVDRAIAPNEHMVADLGFGRLDPRQAALLVRGGVGVQHDELDGLTAANVVVRAGMGQAHGALLG